MDERRCKVFREIRILSLSPPSPLSLSLRGVFKAKQVYHIICVIWWRDTCETPDCSQQPLSL